MNQNVAAAMCIREVLSADGFTLKTGARSFDCIEASTAIPVSDVIAFRDGVSAVVQDASDTDIRIRILGAPDHWLIVPLGVVRVTGHLSGTEVSTSPWTPGRVVLLPADSQGEWCIESPSAPMIHLHVSPARLHAVAEAEPLLRARTRLLPAVNREDAVLASLAENIMRETRARQAGSRLLIDSLFQSLCVHLMRTYSVEEDTANPRRYFIAPFRLKRAQEFIEEHLEQHIALEDIAAAAGLSPFHFSRIFKHATGLAPYRYVLLRRVRRAKGLLESTSRPLAEIALACGFSTQQHLTEIFRRHTGSPPGRYRLRKSVEL